MQGEVTVYLHFEQSRLVKKRRVMLSDVASIYVKEAIWKHKIGSLELFVFEEGKKDKHSFCVMKVVELIGARYPEVALELIGEPDFVVEYEPETGGAGKKLLEWCKVVFVCFAMFFGAAFTIVTFNKDASVEEIFSMVYRLSEGAERSGPGELEIAYSIGIPLGIILFFDHFLKKKIDSDPTPLQIQMRQYEKDVNSTVIENASREGKKEDV